MPRMMYHGDVLAETDVMCGEYGTLWLRAKVRPRWWWIVFHRLPLFFVLVRDAVIRDGGEWSMTLAQAWDVSAVAVGICGPVPVHGGSPQ